MSARAETASTAPVDVRLSDHKGGRLDGEREDLAGRIAGHDDLAFNRRAGAADQAGGLRDAVMAPQPPPVIGRERHELVLDGHGGRRRAPSATVGPLRTGAPTPVFQITLPFFGSRASTRA